MDTIEKVQTFLAALIDDQNEAFKAQIAEAERQTRGSIVVVTGEGSKAVFPRYIINPQNKTRVSAKKIEVFLKAESSGFEKLTEKEKKIFENLTEKEKKNIKELQEAISERLELKYETLPEDKAVTSLINRTQALLSAAKDSKNNPTKIEKSLAALQEEYQELKILKQQARGLALEIEISRFNLAHPEILPKPLLSQARGLEKLRGKDLNALSTLQKTVYLKSLTHRINAVEKAFREQLLENKSPRPPSSTSAMTKVRSSKSDKGPAETETPRPKIG